jgi:hypothetical protein
MTFGVLGTAATVASASGGNNFYVATNGTNTGNNCSNSANPCLTISYALQKQAAENVSGTIHVAAGTYVEQITATTANNNVTILGATEATTIIEPPASGLLSDTDTDGSQPQYYVVDVQPGTTGFNLKKLTVNGLNASSFLDTDGLGCAQDFVGVYYHASSGTMKKVAVTGIDMPADLFGCQGGLGVYVNSTNTNSAVVTMTKLSLTAPQSSTLTKADLPANTYNSDILPVKSVPGSFTGGSITVNGYKVQATPDGPKNLFITGTTSTDSPSGSVVNYNAFTPAYDKNGITCDDNETTCTITGSTIQGSGPTNAIAQNGIQAFGAASTTIGGSLTGQGNTISGNSYSGGGGAGNAAAGILLLNNGPTSVVDNTVSTSDVNIYAGEVQVFGLVYSPAGTWTISGNTVSNATSTGASAGEGGYGEGIQVDGTTNTVNVQGNNVSGSPQANILMLGVQNANIGGSGAGQGNTSTGSPGAGMVVGGPSTECAALAGGNIPGPNCNFGSGVPGTESAGWASHGNAVIGNTYAGSSAGVVVEGAFAPTFMGLSPDPNAAYGNAFGGNNWTGNGLAGVADFSGNANSPPAENAYASGSADSCEPTPGGSPAADALFGPSVSVTNVAVVMGSPTATDGSGNFPASVLAGALIQDHTTPGNVPATTYVSSVTGPTLTMSNAATGTGTADTLYFFNTWAC